MDGILTDDGEAHKDLEKLAVEYHRNRIRRALYSALVECEMGDVIEILDVLTRAIRISAARRVREHAQTA